MVVRPPVLLPGWGLLSMEPLWRAVYSSHQWMRSMRRWATSGRRGAAGEEVLGAVDLGGLGEDGGAAVADEDVDGCAEGGIGADAGVGVGAAALEAEDEVGSGDGCAGDLIGLLEEFEDGGDSLLDGAGGAPLLLNGAGAQGVGGAGEGDERLDLVGLAAEAEEEDAGEVGVGGVADEDAAEEVGGFAVFGHAAAGAVGDGDDAVDVGVGAEDFGGEVGGDAAGDGGGAVDGGEDADVVAGGDAAVGADDALEGGGLGRGVRWGGIRSRWSSRARSRR